MNLKDAIKQNKDFSSNTHEALVNVQYTSGWLTQLNNQIVAPYKLSMQQFNVLRILRGQHPKSVTVKFIIERMIDKSSNASRLVDKLLAKDLVERHQCPNDRRQVDISISDKGLDMLAVVDKDLERIYDAINLNEDEAKTLSTLLDKLRS